MAAQSSNKLWRTTMLTRTGFFSLAAIFIFAVTSGACGQSPAPAVTTSSAGPVQECPWLHPGLRLSFRNSDATFQGNITQFEQRDDGSWTSIDQSQPSGAGAGITQITVGAATPQKIAITIESYLLDAMNRGGAPIFQNNQGDVSDAVSSTYGAPWIKPAIIESFLRNPPPPPVAVTRMKWKVGDHICEAAVIRNEDPAAYSVHVYDAATGILLHSASRVSGTPSFDPQTGQLAGSTVVLHTVDFLGARDLTLPWANEPIPEWIANTNIMHFAGQYVIHNTNGLRDMPMDLQGDMKIVDRNDAWVTADQTMQMRGANPSQAKHVWCSNQIGGGWIGPAALAKMQQGQLIDEDPLTKVKTVVSHVDDNSVVITCANSAGEQSFQYNKSTGMFISALASQAPLHTEIIMRLTGTQ
jgi:hypothetical protein